MEGERRIKSFETRRLKTCSWRRKGDNSQEREKRRKTDLFKQTLKVMFHIITRAYESYFWPVRRSFLTESIVVSVSIRELVRTQSLKRQSTDSNRSVVGEPTTTTSVRAMNKNQTLLEINAAIKAMLDSNWSYFSPLSYMKWFITDSIIRCLLYDNFL